MVRLVEVVLEPEKRAPPPRLRRGGGAGELHHFRERQRLTLLARDLPGRGGLPARSGGVHELIDLPIPEGPCTNISLS